MYISHLILKNWKNFQNVDIDLRERLFIVGPNASGKSNFLDAFRFLHDIAKQQGGGLQKAVEDRGGISKIRCLSARRSSDIVIGITIKEDKINNPEWRYEISLTHEGKFPIRQPVLRYEQVWEGQTKILSRPNDDDKNDRLLMIQTHLEQINSNKKFRQISSFFQATLYLHLVPQILRYPELFLRGKSGEDYYGQDFLSRIANATERIRRTRLKKIEKVLKNAVPQLNQLAYEKDNKGIPHLEAVYEHWRGHGAKQREEQFSDGTLRLIGFLWSLLESDSLLLLEEPELSLHSEIVKNIPGFMQSFIREKKRQIIITTHSSDLLTDKGIAPEEVILLIPSNEGTTVKLASTIKEVIELLNSGFTVAEAVIPHTVPKQLELPLNL